MWTHTSYLRLQISSQHGAADQVLRVLALAIGSSVSMSTASDTLATPECVHLCHTHFVATKDVPGSFPKSSLLWAHDQPTISLKGEDGVNPCLHGCCKPVSGWIAVPKSG